MPKHDASKTPPRARRLRGDGALTRFGGRLTPAGKSARDYLLKYLEEHPQKKYPATESGAANLALEEAAKARGWTPPKPPKPEGES
ncbi:hypothetical protein QEG98_28115 [Myxococcus sp. MxC21-1]|uniref:hypothetical protein n=1 Tax=Myxococcus sp. MxC21-1 TaxID=3041439 RepID=UPI00292D21D2|nr:hypothetical protein [Myxococcus sp. MxC21-1]WNZ59871.1 hypothetical protein QEG98_28115 [Myxococcus sp. MxC21-1]